MNSESGPGGAGPGDAANDRGIERSGDAPRSDPVNQKLATDGNYYFEICRNRPHDQFGASEIPAIWSWRLLSPAGATMIECGGYADLESCRAVVDVLQQKAGSALVSIPS